MPAPKSENHLYQALTRMVEQSDLRLPYGSRPIRDSWYAEGSLTGAEWRTVKWNPPEGTEFTEPDPNASPKPTWAQIVAAYTEIVLYHAKYDQTRFAREITNSIRTRVTDRTIEFGGEMLHIGDGLDHMAGLDTMATHSMLAGRVLPQVVLRDENHVPRTIWTQAALQEFLSDVALRENQVEAAHNSIIAELHKQAAIRDDETQSLAKREAALNKVQAFIDNYKTALEAAMGAIDLTTLPADLTELKGKLRDMLEAAGMRHVKFLRGVVSQQGIDLPAACDDAEDAERKVAQEVWHGGNAIQDAETVAKAKTAFNRAETSIERIKALNTPTFHLRELTAEQPSPARFTKKKLLLTVRNPEMEVGAISLHGQVVSGNANLNVTSKTVNEIECDVEIGTAEATMDVVARNLCGPSVLRVTLTPPSED